MSELLLSAAIDVLDVYVVKPFDIRFFSPCKCDT